MITEIESTIIDLEVAESEIEEAKKRLQKLMGKLKASTEKNLKPNINETILRLFAKEIGTKEIDGRGSNPRVELYHSYASENNDQPMDDSVPWCSSFVCFLVEKAGRKSTNSRAARSWLNYEFKTPKPIPGDIVIFWRGSRSSWKGHVGIFLGETENSIICGGGNQSDEVNISYYSKSKVLGFRSHGRLAFSESSPSTDLWDLAGEIINHGKIQEGGSVQ